MKSLEYSLKGLRAPLFKILFRKKEHFICPICEYNGPFKDKKGRKNAKCPKCGELERARLQFLVIKDLLAKRLTSEESILHIAPENSFRKYFKKRFKNYVSGDLNRSDVDKNFDVQEIPFPDASFDVVFASHVLEYPADDLKAIFELRRVLKPGGLAVLPIPLVHELTVDRTVRHQTTRMMHEPGLDYFLRFEKNFSKVELFYAEKYPSKHQLLVYRGEGAEINNPLNIGDGWYSDIVPVCYV